MIESWFEGRIKDYGLIQYTNCEVLKINYTYECATLYSYLSVYPQLSPSSKELVIAKMRRIRAYTLDYILACCLGESRHIMRVGLDHNPHEHGYLLNLPKNFQKCILDSEVLMGSCREKSARALWEFFAAKKTMTYKKLLTFMEYIFLCFRWTGGGYGGDPWGYISSLGNALTSAVTPIEMVTVFDRIMHASHCGCKLLTSPKYHSLNSNNLYSFLEFKRYASWCCWLQFITDQMVPAEEAPLREECTVLFAKLAKEMKKPCRFQSDICLKSRLRFHSGSQCPNYTSPAPYNTVLSGNVDQRKYYATIPYRRRKLSANFQSHLHRATH